MRRDSFLRKKINDMEVLYVLSKEKVVTIHTLAKKLNISIQRANARLDRLVEQGLINKIKLPKYSKRFWKPPYDDFIRKSLYFFNKKDLEEWLKRKLENVPEREKQLFFKKAKEVGIVEGWN